VKIIDRYIGRELFISLSLGLGLFTFVLLMEKTLDLMDLIISKRVPVTIVARLFLYLLPALFVSTVPMAVLLAVIATYSRLAADHEVTALKVAGCSLYRLIVPALGIGILAMFFTALNTIYNVPRSAQAFRDLLFVLTQTRATIGIKEKVFNDDFHGLVLYVNRLDEATGTMQGVFVVDTRDQENARVIMAREGRIALDEPQNQVFLQLREGTTHATPKDVPEPYQILGFTSLNLVLSLTDPNAPGMRDKRPSEMSIPELLATLRERTAKAERTADLYVSFHQRFAAPIACLVFIPLGVPLAVRARKFGRGISLVLTLLLSLAYYILMVAGEGMGNRGIIHPFWATWSPNLLLGSVGLLLLIGGNSDLWLPWPLGLSSRGTRSMQTPARLS
jgi:lipopolysaccharide export system permease protein